jgi:isopenicillin N synthase-like dioxygenase
MSFASAKSTDAQTIPVVDITALRDGSAPINVAKALHQASTELGFIYIKGHGISADIIEAARNSAYDFFRQSNTDKSCVKITDKHRGWMGYGTAKMQDDIAPDLKESYLWGYQDENGETPEDHQLRGQNQWPENMADMEPKAMMYFEKVHEVANHLMQGFAIGLGLDENYFLKANDKPISRGSYVYYPPQEINNGVEQFGVGPHTDFGVLTVLCQDNVGGLQVESLDGEWIEAPPIEGTLIVNVGDLLGRWTEGAYRSTPHRVLNGSGRERLSLVMAFDPNPETIVDARGIFGNEHINKDEPITVGDYLIWRFNKAFSYRKKA